jgi:hypothetical protein
MGKRAWRVVRLYQSLQRLSLIHPLSDARQQQSMNSPVVNSSHRAQAGPSTGLLGTPTTKNKHNFLSSTRLTDKGVNGSTVAGWIHRWIWVDLSHHWPRTWRQIRKFSTRVDKHHVCDCRRGPSVNEPQVQPIDNRREDSRLPVFASCVKISNRDLLSNSETGVYTRIRSWKKVIRSGSMS